MDSARQRLKQVFQYLQAVNERRTPVIKQIKGQEWCLPLSGLPEHPSLAKHPALLEFGESLEQDIPVILLKKPLLTTCPTPPDGLLDWLKDGWQNPRLAAEVLETRNALHQGQTDIERFDDDLDRIGQRKAWLSKRATWQINECPARDAQALYERLFALHSQLERESENFELMLGDGIFNWRLDAGGLHHPILLKRLELKFDPRIPAFTLEETDSPSELYTPLFNGDEFAGLPVNKWRQDVENGELHPLGGIGFAEWLHGVVGSFQDGAYLDGELGGEQDFPRMGRAPVVFLRKRNLGYSAAIAHVLADIETATSFPQALLNIVGLFSPIEPAEDDGDTAYANEDEDILLSKPANAQQLQIIRLLEKHHAVLVQGPPGTGKTHTIANILGHLLAQGQSVLVTSHSTKALRVLREQVVEDLRPLCVSVLDSDLASRQQLETAIQAISEKLASGDARQFSREAEGCARQRLEILVQLRDTRHRLQQTIANEYRDVVIGGEAISPSQAARILAAGIGRDDWLPGPLTEGAVLPLSEEETYALYASNGQLTEEDIRDTALPLPLLEEIWPPSHFERQCRDLAQLQAQQLPYRQELWADEVTELATGLTEQLRKTAQTLPDAAQDTWRLAVIQAGMEGPLSSGIWESLCADIEEVVRLAQTSANNRLRFDPQLADKPTVDIQLQSLEKIVIHLQNGKTLRFWHWRKLRKQWRVDTGNPRHSDHFQALHDAALLQLNREALARRWKRQIETLGAPSTEQFGLNLEAHCSQYISHIRQCLEWYGREWSPLLKTLIDSGLIWDKLMAEQAPLLSPNATVETLRQIIQQQLPRIIESRYRRQRLRHLKAEFFEYATHLESMANEACPVVRLMLDALQNQDATAYAQAHARLEQLHQLRPLAEQRAEWLAALQPVAPIWALQLSQRHPPHDQSSPPGKPLQAWLWRQYQEELERRNSQSIAELQQQIDYLGERLRQLTANLIERRAWGAVIDSIDQQGRMALIGWLDIVSRIGKGMGKKVPALQRQARLLMNDCRGSVPVWIMPFSRMVENFNPKEHRFDVLIIDESSQLDITGLLALYMAEKVIIVGDHEQVSPLDVGGDQIQVDNLINIYLQGIPLAPLYDPKTSVYHKARQSFDATVQLIEHFRCVPEIIQFSNHLAYDNKIKPLRETSDSKLKPATIAYQAQGIRERDKNIIEAQTIVSLIQAAIEQPEYKDKSFGVITLLSKSVQAEKIESLLRERISPVEYENRRIICGIPAQFQGDERDVIFLSMIDSPKGNGPLTLRQDGPDGRYKKRYNVAASRAKDQLWVVHSLSHATDLQPLDLRRRLIEHALDPSALMRSLQDAEQRTESEFEKQVLLLLEAAGYQVITQWQVGAYRIDMVVIGGNNNRLAIECDGDRWHPIEKIPEDMARQAILERLGWRFVRLRGSEFFRNPETSMQSIFKKLEGLEILPVCNTPTIDPIDSEIKQRVVRRAEALRHEWAKPKQMEMEV